jgi:hypothetical protein
MVLFRPFVKGDGMRFSARIAVVSILIFLASGRRGKAAEPSVSSLSGQWLDIKMTLAEDRGKRGDPGSGLKEFNAA